MRKKKGGKDDSTTTVAHWKFLFMPELSVGNLIGFYSVLEA